MVEREKIYDELQKNLELQSILAQIALYFIKTDDFENQINSVLETLGENICSSRVYIFEESEDGNFINNTYEWCRKGVKSIIHQSQNIPYESVSMLKDILIKEDKICVEDINDFPEGIRTFLEERGTLSLMAFSLYKNEAIKGYIGFDYCKLPHKCTRSEVKFLQTITGIISNAYNKVYNEKLIIESRERLKNVIKATNVGSWEWDISTGKLTVDETYANILGYELEELKDFTIYDWNMHIERDDFEGSKQELKEHFNGEKDFYNSEVRIKDKNGKSKWITNRGKVINWNRDGSPRIMFGTIFDDTARKKDEEERLRLTMAIEQATITFLMTDINGKIEYANPAFEKKSGYSLDEVIGKNTDFLRSDLTPGEVEQDLRETTMVGKTWEGELVSKRKDGSIYYEEARVSPVTDSKGRTISFLFIKQDITERKKLEEKILENLVRDSLTNIYNRRYVFEILEKTTELYKRKGDNFSVAILDIDFFKNVNDTYGHLAGDYILQSFVSIIEKNIRSSDILGRYGGEEFIIIFMDSNKENSKIIIDRILEEVRESIFKYDENEIKFTFSAGICEAVEINKVNISHEDLIKTADDRLYKAKNTGRNKIVIE